MKILPRWTDEVFEGTIHDFIQVALDAEAVDGVGLTPGCTKRNNFPHGLKNTLDPLNTWYTFHAIAYSNIYDELVVFRDHRGGYNLKQEYRDGSFPGDTNPIKLGKILELGEDEVIPVGEQSPVYGSVQWWTATKSKFEEYKKKE